MGLLSKLINLFKRPDPADFKSSLRLDADGVTCTHPNGESEHVRWDDLVEVRIVTTSEGPFIDDIFWILIGKNGGCLVPSETPEAGALQSKLGELPGFDHNAVIDAMCCADDNEFLCWRAQTGAPQ